MKQAERIEQLRELVRYHRARYHDDDAPEISDEAYDSLVEELRQLEGADESDTESEVNIVGGRVSEAFEKVTHQARQWSFANIFDETELKEWVARIDRTLRDADYREDVTYVTEQKIDGLKVVLTYERGQLVEAATRGDGVMGESVLHTVRTIKDIPEQLTHAVDLVCVGEVWLGEKVLAKINEGRAAASLPLFANPRNAAAGSLRQLDPAVAAARPLRCFTYDIDVFTPHDTSLAPAETQAEELALLAELGLPTNAQFAVCTDEVAIETYYQKWVKKRGDVAYGIDGVVIKVNEVAAQRELGYTAKSPRFGVAYKFPAVQKTTVVEDIILQVGRTGVVTPVACFTPVLIDGSTVARATLHNQDFITELDVRIGDTVVIQKSGDVIPEVLQVLTELRPASAKKYTFPKTVAVCGADGQIERIPGEAAFRCVSMDSPHIHRQRLYYFVGKTALNIDGVGPRIIDALLEKELIADAPDIFTLTKEDFLSLEGFKEKSAQNAIDAIAAARTVPLHRVLIGLSIEGVGEETARLLAGRFASVAALRAATIPDLTALHGIGSTVAEAVVHWFEDVDNQAFVERLLTHLTIEAPRTTARTTKLSGKKVVFTGSLTTLTRNEAKERARRAGALVASSVSKATDYLVAGEDAGSKADKAAALGVEVLTEAAFLKLAAE